jgi:hypothetical protein
VTVEHIFPKSPKGDWKQELEADPSLGKMLNRLGNLCLLTDVNRALGNKPWEEKLEVIQKVEAKDHESS